MSNKVELKLKNLLQTCDRGLWYDADHFSRDRHFGTLAKRNRKIYLQQLQQKKNQKTQAQ